MVIHQVPVPVKIQLIFCNYDTCLIASSLRSSSLPNKVFSPNLRVERKPTPTKKIVNTKIASRASNGSDTESSNKGVLKQRNTNASPLRIMGQNDQSRKLTPKRDQITPQGPVFGLKRQSSKPRNYSPSSRYFLFNEDLI